MCHHLTYESTDEGANDESPRGEEEETCYHACYRTACSLLATTADIRQPDGGYVVEYSLGASTEESEDNCAIMAAEQLTDYLENGNIVNSVNYPALSMPRSGESRVCVLHKNIPNVIATLSAAISAKGHNIENMASKSKGDYAYTMFDISGNMCPCEMDNLEGVLRVRCI